MNDISVFADFNIYMGKILQTMMDDPELAKLLYYDHVDPLSQEDFDTSLLFERNLFPYDFIPDVVSEPKSVLFVGFDNIETNEENGKIADFDIVFNFLVHNDLWKIANQCLRPYSILHRVDCLFNNKFKIGIFKLILDVVRHYRPNSKYSGFSCVYRASDFNSVRNV
jgi:hypothetical protein